MLLKGLRNLAVGGTKKPTDRPLGGEDFIRIGEVVILTPNQFIIDYDVHHIAVEPVPELMKDSEGNIRETLGNGATSCEVLAESLIRFVMIIKILRDFEARGRTLDVHRPITFLTTISGNSYMFICEEIYELTNCLKFSHLVSLPFTYDYTPGGVICQGVKCYNFVKCAGARLARANLNALLGLIQATLEFLHKYC